MDIRPAPGRSPLLPGAGTTVHGGLPAPAPHTAAELAALLRLLADHRHPRLRSVAIGRSRDDASRTAAAEFADAWHAAGHAAGHAVPAVVDCPPLARGAAG
ncbi:hypothetical protein ACFRAR_25005 [Kitasatospora sp. NPDC056651]|uniref:hypothetical protein n=1 Tax=Kitasatospora sp. NPDC056651 TaxID=3345892 RepID=UPI00369B3EDC